MAKKALALQHEQTERHIDKRTVRWTETSGYRLSFAVYNDATENNFNCCACKHDRNPSPGYISFPLVFVCVCVCVRARM